MLCRPSALLLGAAELGFLARYQLFAQCPQFAPPRRAGFGITQLQRGDGVEQNTRHDEACIWLVIGGNDVPRRVMSAGSAQAFRVGLHILLPILSLLHIRGGKLPILPRCVDPVEEAPALLLFREVQKKFDDLRAIAIEMALQIQVKIGSDSARPRSPFHP